MNFRVQPEFCINIFFNKWLIFQYSLYPSIVRCNNICQFANDVRYFGLQTDDDYVVWKSDATEWYI